MYVVHYSADRQTKIWKREQEQVNRNGKRNRKKVTFRRIIRNTNQIHFGHAKSNCDQNKNVKNVKQKKMKQKIHNIFSKLSLKMHCNSNSK